MPQPWADQPYSLIPTPKYLGMNTDPAEEHTTHLACEMSNLHNSIIRGLNSIYLQAPHVSSSDYANFIGYCLCWCQFIEEHHHTEDTMFFPAIDKAAGGDGKSGMLVNSQQHETFHEPMVNFHEYLKEVQRTGQFSGEQTQALISAFGPALHAHLKDEIDTLLALRSLVSPADLSKIMDDGKKAAMRSLAIDPTLFMLMNVDSTFEEGLWKYFPEAGPSAPLWVIRNVIGRVKSAGYWKYASCGRNGVPRPLYALS